jgi:NAD(P)-dependent dehydrogenase (short-subunit alcohol dehydrogenase family)
VTAARQSADDRGQQRGGPAANGRPAALVTGSAKGAGRAIVLALAEDGYDVAVHYRRSRDEAEAVAALAAGRGARTAVVQADVRVEEQARGLVDAANEAFGRLDVLVNNVGDYHQGPLRDLSGAVWRDMLASNLDSTFYTCQQAVQYLTRGGSGRIVNIGYAGAEQVRARPGIAAYGIAKTGVILYSKALARTLAADGVTVNVVSPGVLENSVSQPIEEIPMGRLGRLEELVGAVRYLVSPQAAYVTGVTLEVAGGWNT